MLLGGVEEYCRWWRRFVSRRVVQIDSMEETDGPLFAVIQENPLSMERVALSRFFGVPWLDVLVLVTQEDVILSHTIRQPVFSPVEEKKKRSRKESNTSKPRYRT